MTTYIPLELPGLVGNEPLGFLAAIGLTTQLRENMYLSWDENTNHAIVHLRSERYSSVQDLVATLVDQFSQIKPGHVIPYTTDFPLKRRPGGPDPLRMQPDEFRRRQRHLHHGMTSWLGSTLTDQELDADGHCAVTPYIALRGRQTIGSFWYYPMMEVRKDPPRLLTEALTSRQRVQGADGWLLDQHAAYSTDPDLRGPGGSMAVPGATWLATLALRELPYTRRATTRNETVHPTLPTLWHRIDGQDVLVWPLWRLPATTQSIKAMWNVGWGHAHWRPYRRTDDGPLEISIWPTHGVSAPDNLDHIVDIDIAAMCAATRPSLDTGPGPLTPIPITTRHDLPHRFGDDYPVWGGDQHASI